MDHPFTPPSRIPSLPTPKKEKRKAETYFTLPPASDAHLTHDELQQLTRSSLEGARPVFSRSHSRESRSESRGSTGYDKRYGRAGSVSSIPAPIPPYTTSSTGLTGLELMQSSYSSAALQHPQPYHKVSQYLTGGHSRLPPDSCAVSVNSASPNDGRGRGLQDSTDGPSAPAPTSNPVHAAQHLIGSDLRLPPDEIPASVGHLIGADMELPASEDHLTGSDLHLPPDEIPASVGHLIGADLKLPYEDAPAFQSPFPLQPRTIDELEKSASVAALLLERMDPPAETHYAFLPLDDTLAPTPPPLPARKESVEVVYENFEIVTTTTMSYEPPTPPGVMALITNLGHQGDASSDPNWPLPAKTPVYTFLPPPPSASPIASSLEASIPSNIPSPVGSPVTTTQELPMQSFMHPPRTLSSVVAELSAAPVQQPSTYTMIPPPHDIATSAAPYNQPSSATPNSMAPSNQDYQPGFSTAETSLDPNNQPFTMPASHYIESTPVSAARAAFDQTAQQSEGRVKMPGRFPTDDSVRTIVDNSSSSNYGPGNGPMPSSIAPYSQPTATSVQYPVTQYHADPEAVAAARAAYVHPSRCRTASSVLYNQPHIQESSPMPRALGTQPSAMPSSMATHYRESSAVAAVKEAYDQPAGSMQTQFGHGQNQPAAMPSSMATHYRECSAAAAARDAFDQPAGSMRDTMVRPDQAQYQPAAMPSSMASHYRESSAVAKARVAYDEPNHPTANRLSSNQSPSGLAGAIAGFNRAFNSSSPTPKAVEMSAFHNTQVQSQIQRVPVPVHGSTPGTERTMFTKPPPVVVQDAALAPQPVFRHSSQLNHEPVQGSPVPSPQPQRLAVVPNQRVYQGQYQGQQAQYAGQQPLAQAPPIDRQLPALAPSLYIETVSSFPRGPPKEASFWRRRKKALIIMLVCVLLGIGVGIVFVAQSFYKRWGGVGFLGAPVQSGKRSDAAVIRANGGHIGKRGFELQQNAKDERRHMEDNKVGYLQAANGDILAIQEGSEGKRAEKGLMENMLMAGYKRGWGTDFKEDEAESAPVVPVNKVKHVTVIPVGSDARLTTPFAPDFEIGSTWWNARMNDMQKRGEQIINEHPTPEDALAHAAVLAQRFVDEIKARIEGSGLAGECSASGPSCPPCCRSDTSDVDMAVVLASDYVNRVPFDVANSYDLELLLESMDTEDMKRPAQEVAMLAAQGYIQRVPEDVTEMIQSQTLNKRGVISQADIDKLMMGEDVPESVTVTVTHTRISTGAPTGLTPQDQAKQFASGYAESVPHEDEIAYLRSKRSPKVISWEALARRNAEPDVMPWADLHDASKAAIGSACAGIYSWEARAQAPEAGPLAKRAHVAKEVVKHVFSKRNAVPDVSAWASLKDAERAEIASTCAIIYAAGPLDDIAQAIADGIPVVKRSWSPHEVAMQMAGEYAKYVPDHAPASPVDPDLLTKRNAAPDVMPWAALHDSAPSTGGTLVRRLPNGVPKEPAELIAAASSGDFKHADAKDVKVNAAAYARTAPKQGEVAGRSWSPYEVAKQMAGEYAKAVPVKEPLAKRAAHGDLKEPAELMAAALFGALKSEEASGRWTDEDLEESLESDKEKRKNVPFVTCGDQRKGCEAHGHPEICCPVLHTCHKSPTTNSGIICCPGVVDCSGRHPEVLAEAFCPPNTIACPVEASGGCCPTLDQCSPNGCLEFVPGLAPSDDPAKAHTETRALPLTETIVMGLNGETLEAQSRTITVTEQVGGKVIVTATVAKDGEVASGMSSLSPEQTYADGMVIKPGSFKSSGGMICCRGWKGMVVRLGIVACGMALM